ncbi:hypothetical protein [Buttiauxella agrestis]|uniref:hypothetical protein n=1 Tax=Buttiauxella agrestis TaxID=82977 RepID=UPI00155F56EA|nr:hypothetical protein [Buttiauxella agrestis]BCG09030.1 hypothetical protein BADSM9389_16960 [Buttiauxella agrestis]
MNKKELILSSGFTYRELLTMKNNFHAMRKWYRLERKPIPESEPTDLIGHILLTANDASAFIFIFFIINATQAIYLRYEHHDFKHPAVAFAIFLVILPVIIYFNNNQHLKPLILVKLIFLHYKCKNENLHPQVFF